MTRKRLAAAIVFVIIIAVGIYIGVTHNEGVKGLNEVPGAQSEEEAKTVKASILWEWRGAFNGIALNVKVWRGKVYVLVRTDDDKLILYLLNSTTGEFINKTLVSKSVNYASLKLLGNELLVGVVQSGGEVKIIKYDPDSLRVMEEIVLDKIDVSLVDVTDLELIKDGAVIAGGIHTENGLKPILLSLSPERRNWSKIIESVSGYFIDVAITGTQNNTICAVASSGMLYCFSLDGNLIVEKSLKTKITGLYTVNNIVLAVGVSEKGTIKLLTLNPSNAEVMSSSSLGEGYPLSLHITRNEFVALIQINGKKYMLLIADVSISKGILQLSDNRKLLINIPEPDASLFKVTYSEGLVYLAGRIGVKPFVAAVTGP